MPTVVLAAGNTRGALRKPLLVTQTESKLVLVKSHPTKTCELLGKP